MAVPDRKFVLVIDDDQNVRETMSEILHEFGYECLLAEDGKTGVARYLDHPGDILFAIVDMAMEGMDGAETCRKLMEIDPQAKLILASGYFQNEEVAQLLGEGVSAYLQKPFQIEELLRTIARILGQED